MITLDRKIIDDFFLFFFFLFSLVILIFMKCTFKIVQNKNKTHKNIKIRDPFSKRTVLTKRKQNQENTNKKNTNI